MYLYIYIYVYIYIYMYVCIHIYIYVYIYMYLYICFKRNTLLSYQCMCVSIYIYIYVGSGHPSYDDNPGNGYEWNDQPPILEIDPRFERGTCKTLPHRSFFACTHIVLVNPTSIVLITCSNASLKLLPNPKYGFL